MPGPTKPKWPYKENMVSVEITTSRGLTFTGYLHRGNHNTLIMGWLKGHAVLPLLNFDESPAYFLGIDLGTTAAVRLFNLVKPS
jgi:hypothetical protein